MHCAQARNLVALLIGDDIGDSDRPEVQSHLAECDSCKTYHSELLVTQQQLMTVAAESDVRSPGLWTALKPQVQLANKNQSTKQFNGWVAALAVAATVMAMFAISSDMTPVQSDNAAAPQFSPTAAPVSFEPAGRSRMIRSDEIDRQRQQQLQDLTRQTF